MKLFNHTFLRIFLDPTETTAGGGNALQNSNIGQGLIKFLNDLTTLAMVAGPIACALAAIVFVTRRSMADEQDGKMWTRRITIAICCGVGIFLVSGTIALITSYFV